jgi:hypothetical protein
MLTFKADKNIYLTNEFTSWIWTLSFAAVLYLTSKFLFSIPQDKILVAVIVIILLKIADLLTQFRTAEIQIDRDKHQLTILFKSIMSGERKKQMQLKDVQTEILRRSKFINAFSRTSALKIHLPKNNFYQILGRYGFSNDTLEAVNNAIRNIKSH